MFFLQCYDLHFMAPFNFLHVALQQIEAIDHIYICKYKKERTKWNYGHEKW